jgi:hypothetical protein
MRLPPEPVGAPLDSPAGLGDAPGDRLPRHTLRLLAAGLIFLSLAGAGLILYATRWGPWAYSDSVEFIGSARNLAAGRGLGLYSPSGRFMPLELHPPLYPLLLAGAAAAGVDPLIGARWLGALLFALVLALIGLATWGLTRSLLLAFSIVATVLLSARWLDLYSGAMTEPLFLLLVLATLCALVVATRTARRWWIVAAGVLAGLSVLTRYPGVALVAAGGAYLLLFRAGGWRSRLIDAGLYVLPATALVAIWLSRLPPDGGQLLGIDPPSWSEAWQSLTPVRLEVTSYVWGTMPFARWLPGLEHRGRMAGVGIASLAGLGVFVAAAVHRGAAGRGGVRSSAAGSAFSLLSLLVAAYVAMIAVAYISRDVRLDLIDRTLMPISLGLSAALLCLAWFVVETWGTSRLASLALALIGLCIAIRGLASTLALAQALHTEGRGYTSAGWRDSGVIRGLSDLDPRLVVVTNEPAAVELWTGRVAYHLLELEPGDGTLPTGECSRAGEVPVPGLPAGTSVLALFDSIYGQWLTVSGEATRDRVDCLTAGMTIYSDYWDGTIFLLPAE